MSTDPKYERLPKERVSCACCRHDDTIEVVKGDRYGFGLRTVVCERCGLIFTSPRPDPAWFDRFYRHDYRRFYETVETPDDEYVARDWIRPRHERVVEWLSPRLPSRGRLLDIGCAEGTFLDVFRHRLPGWEVFGVEPSASFATFARSRYGLEGIRTGGLEELEGWPAESFDLVTANHLLEHLLDPNELFSAARRLLKEDGRVFVDVPDAEGRTAGIENLHIAHVYHFSRDTLRNFFVKHGFDVEADEEGDETPQWTIRALGRKEPAAPSDWRPPRAAARDIARRFRRRCRPAPHRRAWSHVRRALASR